MCNIIMWTIKNEHKNKRDARIIEFPKSDIFVQNEAINSDGNGLMVKANSELYYSKSTTKTIDELIDDMIYQYPATLKAGTEWIAHCRLATHGIVSDKNCHPFTSKDRLIADNKPHKFEGDILMMHNGIFNYFKRTDATTDSQQFADLVLPLMLEVPTLQTSKDLLTSSKVVILQRNKKTLILNKDQFRRVGDVTVSNLNFISYPYKIKTAKKTAAKKTAGSNYTNSMYNYNNYYDFD